MNAWVPGRTAVLEWTVKESLVGYMQRDESFTVQASGGASFDPARGVRVPGEIGEDGVLRLTGEITLSAHDGALAIALVAAELDPEKGLSIADPIDGLPRRMTLVTVKRREDVAVGDSDAGAASGGEPSEVGQEVEGNSSRDENVVRFATFLGYDADLLFMYKYSTRSPFDELRVRIP
ncbi:hypothetical protein ACR5KS_11155 [Leucobacter sp. W1153]|uniref:hypothetical protein n=1 Tax=Leucobacter sp. W1153 TaxID=3439064 RepID=UPI003F3B6CAD